MSRTYRIVEDDFILEVTISKYALATVQIRSEGQICYPFYGDTERDVTAKANAFIAEKRTAFLKRLGAKAVGRAGEPSGREFKVATAAR
jgi:hypothetical protein